MILKLGVNRREGVVFVMWFKIFDKDKEKGCRWFDNGVRGCFFVVYCVVVFCFKCILMLINWFLMFFCRWLEMYR